MFQVNRRLCRRIATSVRAAPLCGVFACVNRYLMIAEIFRHFVSSREMYVVHSDSSDIVMGIDGGGLAFFG